MKRFYILALSALMVVLLPPALRADDKPDEYTIKAAILYKFIKYVEWPDKPHQINICVVGSDPFGSRLDIVEKKSSPELGLKVVRNVGVSSIEQCQLAFISASEQGNIKSILAEASKYPVLTMSDASGFASNGGNVEFVLTGDSKIKFVVNLKAVTAAHLSVDPQLLEIAQSVIR